jgi:hypothetical protein
MTSSSFHPTAEERVLNERDPELLTLCEKRKTKCRRHDSNDRERTLVQVNRASDYVWICRKRAPPQIFAEYDDGWSAGFAVFGKKRSAREGLLAKK